MGIRIARADDIPALVEVGRRMHALTRFRRFDYDAAKVAHSLAALLERGGQRHAFLVAEDSAQRVVGALVGLLEQHIFSDELTASVVHYDVLPEARMGGYGVRLLVAFERWAARRGVVEIAFGINSGESTETLARFARRMGYVKVGENFVKETR